MKIKDIIKRNWKKVVSLMIVAGFSVSVLTACGQKNNEVTPDPAEQKSEQIDPKPTDPVVEPTNPIIPEDPTSVDPTPVDPQPEDPTPVDPQPVDPKPEDPTPVDPQPEDPTPVDPQPTDPEDPTPVDPQPEELDFSALEEKLVSVVNNKSAYKTTLEGLLNVSIFNNELNTVVDSNYRSNNRVVVYAVEINNSLNTQDDLNRYIDELDSSKLIELEAIIKTKTDITVNGETYSKEGIEGDNIFARQCGIDNAYMTYLSDLGAKGYSNYSSGYGRGLYVLIITEDNYAYKYQFTVDYATDSGNHWDNFFIEGKHNLIDSQQIDLGEPLNLEQEKTSIAVK